MSNFTCEHCASPVLDSPKGYVTGCEHYPIPNKPVVTSVRQPAPKRTTADLIRRFLALLEIVEVSDSGREFRPNQIYSCRAVDGAEINEILLELKKRLAI